MRKQSQRGEMTHYRSPSFMWPLLPAAKVRTPGWSPSLRCCEDRTIKSYAPWGFARKTEAVSSRIHSTSRGFRRGWGRRSSLPRGKTWMIHSPQWCVSTLHRSKYYYIPCLTTWEGQVFPSLSRNKVTETQRWHASSRGTKIQYAVSSVGTGMSPKTHKRNRVICHSLKHNVDHFQSDT